MTSILYLFLLNPITQSYEPVDEALLEEAIVVEEDGRLTFDLAEGEQLMVSDSATGEGSSLNIEAGDIYLSTFDLIAQEYVAIPTSDLYDALGEGLLTFTGAEGETIRVSDRADDEGSALYLTQL